MAYDINSIDKAIQRLRSGKKYESESDTIRKGLLVEVSKDILTVLKPLLFQIAENSKVNASEIKRAISESRINVDVTSSTPDVNVNVPDVYVPEIRVPTPLVNYTPPAIHIPDIKMPEQMEVNGWINLMGYDRGLLNNPLPVQLRDASGKPVNLFENLTTLIGGSGGGGKTDYLTIKGYGQSAFSELLNPDGRVKVELPSGSSGLTDAELRASAVPVIQASGAIDSVYVTGLSGSLAASLIDSSGIQYSGSNPLPITIVAGAAATSAVNVVDSSGVAYTTDNPIPIILVDSGITLGVSGTVLVSDVTASVKSALIDSSGVQYSGSNPVPVSGTVAVSGVTNSVSANVIDSTGVPFEGANPFPIRLVTGAYGTASVVLSDSSGVAYGTPNPMSVNINGATNSTISVGPVAGDVADDGSAPVQFGGIARTANPTAVAANDVVKATFDDLGRQLTRPVQVRDLIATAYVAVSTGTEATLITGIASTCLDLIKIMMSNNSTVAVGVDIRSSTAGSIVQHYEIPANGVVGESLSVPWPQDNIGNNWTVDLPDITGTTVYVSALFSKEI